MVKKRVGGFFALLIGFAVVLFLVQSTYFNHITGSSVFNGKSVEETKSPYFDVIEWESDYDILRVKFFASSGVEGGKEASLRYEIINGEGIVVETGIRKIFVSSDIGEEYAVQIPFREISPGIYDLKLFMNFGNEESQAVIKEVVFSDSKLTGATIGVSKKAGIVFAVIVIVAVIISGLYRRYSYKSSLKNAISKTGNGFIKLDV